MGNYSSNSWSTSEVVRQIDPFASIDITPMSRVDAKMLHELAATPDEAANGSCCNGVKVESAIDPGTATALLTDQSNSIAIHTLLETLVAPVTRPGSGRRVRIVDDVGNKQNVAEKKPNDMAETFKEHRTAVSDFPDVERDSILLAAVHEALHQQHNVITSTDNNENDEPEKEDSNHAANQSIGDVQLASNQIQGDPTDTVFQPDDLSERKQPCRKTPNGDGQRKSVKEAAHRFDLQRTPRLLLSYDERLAANTSSVSSDSHRSPFDPSDKVDEASVEDSSSDDVRKLRKRQKLSNKCGECFHAFRTGSESEVERHNKTHTRLRLRTWTRKSDGFTSGCDTPRSTSAKKKQAHSIDQYTCTEGSYVQAAKQYYRCSARKASCSMVFSSIVAMKKHALLHQNGPNKCYACPHCKMLCSSVASWKHHKQLHTEEKPYVCNGCAHNFKSLASLKTHEYRHICEMSYVCSFCGDRARCLSDWKAHENMHTGE